MALSGTLVADFSSFRAAVESTTTQLRSFQTGAASVEKSLTRMADSFSGRRILQEAQLASKAVQDLGGVATLTANEQQKLNATVTEAVAKYKALGQQAPADLINLQRETQHQAGLIESLTTKLGPLGTALAGAFSVGAVINFGRELLAFSSQMSNLSAQTDIGVEELQALNFAAAGADIPIEVLANAISAMSKRLIEGDTSAVGAVERLHLNLKELQAGNPHQAFEAIARAAKDLENPISELSDLFGEKLARQILRLAHEDLPALEDEARKSGAVLDKELIDKADAFGDAWARQVIRFKALLGEVVITTGGANARLQNQIDTLLLDPKQLDASIKKQLEDLKKAAAAPSLGILPPSAKPIAFSDAQVSAFEATLDHLNAAKAEEARKADQINRDRNEAEVRWLKASQEQNLAWADALTKIERDMLNERRDLESDFYANEESKAFAVQKRQLDAFTKDVDRMNEEIQSALKVSAAGKVSETFGQSILDNLKSLQRTVPQTIVNAFTGGGGLAGALKGIGVQLADAFLEPFVATFIAGMVKAVRDAIKKIIAEIAAAKIGEKIAQLFSAGSGGGGGGKNPLVSLANSALPLFLGNQAGPGGGGLPSAPHIPGVAVGPIIGAAVGYGVGEATGSKTAGALAGAGTGAAIGFATGGPIGAAIGFGVGLVAGLVGGADAAGRKANDVRDKDLAQFGPAGDGSGSGFRKLADRLFKLDGDEHLFKAFIQAKNVDAVRKAFSAIMAELAKSPNKNDISLFDRSGNLRIKSFQYGGFVPAGIVQPAILHGPEYITPGNQPPQPQIINHNSVYVTIQAMDAASFDRPWKERFVPMLHQELLTNQLGTVTAINRVVAKK